MPGNTVHPLAEEQLIPQLRTYCDQLRAAASDAVELTAHLSGRQFNWKPAPDRWSVAQCLDHLNVAGNLLLPKLEKAIRKGHENKTFSEPPFRYGFISRLFIRRNAPSSRSKMKTFKEYEPSEDQSFEKSEVVSRFERLQEALITQATEANGLDLKKIKVGSPVSRWLRISLGAWFAATIAHEQRHLKQARAVISDADFPAAEG